MGGKSKSGRDLLSASLQVVFERMDSPEVVELLEDMELDRGLLKEMENALLSSHALLNYAVMNLHVLKNPAMREWLHELQGAVFDAEDLLQLILTEALRLKVEEVPNKFFSKSMKSILSELKLILGQQELIEVGAQTMCPVGPERVPPTLVEESEVYGRDEDRDAILKSLLAKDDNSDGKLSVISIVGEDGVGKTSLARLVYNDEIVKKSFDVRVWVNMSVDFNGFYMLKEVAETVFGFSWYGHEVEDVLKEALIAKKILLVLDDFRKEDYSLWEKLIKLFEYSASASKIIVTTQSYDIALHVCINSELCLLGKLSDENGWKLFAKHAFNDVDPSSYPELQEVGHHILKKCRGLPLTIKLIGSTLQYQLRLEFWQDVHDSYMWEMSERGKNILGALWLSYQYLPLHLKQCFAYCSLFPKNYEFYEEDLIMLWMAQDLLKPDGNKVIEEIGEDCFHDLTSRSLFQQSTSSSGSICYFMHDLVHDLATSAAQNFLCSSGGGGICLCPISKVRHMSKGKVFCASSLLEAKCLRTIFFPSNYRYYYELEKVTSEEFLTTFTRLRVLSFGRCPLTELPDSIGSLKLLRYLNLAGSKIREISDTVCTLYNLQTLILSDCRSLKQLPTNMGKLINLRHLDITQTNLEKMPIGVGNLKDLQILTDFVVGANSGSSIMLLKNLQLLHGYLRLSGLENVVNIKDVTVANLKEKMHITGLDFCWGDHWRSDRDTKTHKEVLNGLEPNKRLKMLRIMNYGGEEFPKWVGGPSFNKLEEISLEGFSKCKVLPPLGQLPFLRKLRIEEFHELVKMGTEFYWGDCLAPTRPFKRLEYLGICNMRNWKEWPLVEGEGGDAAFPNLKTLCLRNCPKLTAKLCIPNTIKEVDIFGCKGLQRSGMHQKQCYENLQFLVIEKSYDFMNSIALDKFPMLEKLVLHDVVKVKSLVYVQESLISPASLSLKLMEPRDYPKLVSFPKGGLHAPYLKELVIESCKMLRSLPEHMNTLLPSLRFLIIRNCPQLEPYPFPFPSHLLKLRIFRCNKLFASYRHWDLQTLKSLSIVGIKEAALEECCPYKEYRRGSFL